MKTLTLTGDENTPAMPMTEAQVNAEGNSAGACARPVSEANES